MCNTDSEKLACWVKGWCIFFILKLVVKMAFKKTYQSGPSTV